MRDLVLALLLAGCPGGKLDSAAFWGHDCSVSYADQDGDGFGDPDTFSHTCDDEDRVADDTDCDDDDDQIHPGADERCNVEDDDCDGEIDEDFTTGAMYQDRDGDGYGDPAHERVGCLEAEGWSTEGTDCADRDGTIHPGVEDICDETDNDCDGETDEDAESFPLYQDWDEDGYGAPPSEKTGCKESSGWSFAGTDCLDSDPNTNPGENEDCRDGWDRDCDGLVDCEDDDCASSNFCGETACSDGVDDDDDGHIDCDDDECWGAPGCPVTVVARVVTGDSTRRAQKTDWNIHFRDCDGTCSCDGATADYRWGWAVSSQSGTARSVEGSVRVIQPGSAGEQDCAWGVGRARIYIHVKQNFDRDGTTTSARSGSTRVGFWVSGACSLSSSAFLPRLSMVYTWSRWPHWYDALWSWDSSGFPDNGHSSWDCGSTGDGGTSHYTVGYQLGPGTRWVCTSAGDCGFR